MALAPDGSVYVTDTGSGAVKKVTPEGVILTLAALVVRLSRYIIG